MKWAGLGLVTISTLVIGAGVPAAYARSRSSGEQAVPSLAGAPTHVVTEVLSSGPPLSAVHRQVLAAAGLHAQDADRWRTGARRAAALPRLLLGLRHGLQDAADLSLKDSVSVTSGGVVIGPRASDFQERSDRNLFVEVRAVWELGELIFTPDELDVSREARARRQEMRELLQVATQYYAQWQRLRVALAPGVATPGNKRGLLQLQFSEIAGALDALTAGWFSSASAESWKSGQRP
ncbi:MAG: hypothetical protein HYV03_07895 [Deltaproteobacteria bacterium]|nr:hypothetical protein [Deltaproteobacteria bacterium]